MAILLLLVFLSGAYPVWLAWRANRSTSLAHALAWTFAAWVAWGGMMLCQVLTDSAQGRVLPRYLALALPGCAGVAVLGARRPGMAAWNFVVLGLLAVLLLPFLEEMLTSGQPLGFIRKLFLAATIAVGIVNYLPTRLALAAVALALGVSGEFMLLDETGMANVQTLAWLSVSLCPWLALLGWRTGRRPTSAFDCAWIEFRDRFGLVWGQRVREQFNRAAANAGWPVHLSWGGLRCLPGTPSIGDNVQQGAAVALQALLKRFM